jgi:hypothetical protein
MALKTDPRAFALRDLRLPRDEMIEAINTAQSVPPASKAMLVELVEKMPLTVRFMRLDAHCHVNGLQTVLSVTLAPI